MLIVQKYGGTSVADSEKIFCVAGRIAQNYYRNHDIVVVLSAQGNTTNILLDKAHEITQNPPGRELDALLSTGEQQSTAAETVGKADDGKCAQRRQPHDGQPDAQVRARHPGLGGEGRAGVHLAEPPGHVPEGGHDTELPESRGKSGDSRTQHGRVTPAVQAQLTPPGHGGLAWISAQMSPPCP